MCIFSMFHAEMYSIRASICLQVLVEDYLLSVLKRTTNIQTHTDRHSTFSNVNECRKKVHAHTHVSWRESWYGLFFSLCAMSNGVYPRTRGNKTNRRTVRTSIQCTLLMLNDKLFQPLLSFPKYSSFELNFIPFHRGTHECAVFALAYVFGRNLVQKLLLLFPKNIGFCESEKTLLQNPFFVDLTLMFFFLRRSRSIIHSLILSRVDEDEPFTIRSKTNRRKKRRHVEIFDKVLRRNIDSSMCMCVCVLCVPISRTFILTDRIFLKRILIWVCAVTEIKVRVKYTHTLKTTAKWQNHMSLALVYRKQYNQYTFWLEGE